MISQDKIQEIIDKTDIVGLVGEYTTLQKRGKGYFGLCPFHADSNPSFSVSVEKKIAMCMSCGEGGNPINFLKKIKNISFEESAKILADRAGVILDINITPKKVDKNAKYYEINKKAQEFYTHYLYSSLTGKKALEYLYNRGLTDETIKMFGIGLAPNEANVLTKVLKDNKYLEIDCMDIGLIKNNGRNYYDLFTNRILFPIKDINDNIIGFSGRIYEPTTNKDIPKYINTMETVIYKKGENLYNLNNAKNASRRSNRLILCEGQMDVIKVHNAGITDVCCSLGTALTTDQANLIMRNAKEVIICYDADNAGVKATAKAIELLSRINVKVLTLPNKMDPDEYISKLGKDSFIDLINNKTIDSIEYQYQSCFTGKNLMSVIDIEYVKTNVFSMIKLLKSDSAKEKYLKQLSIDLDTSYQTIIADFNQYFNKSYTPKVVEKSLEVKKISKAFNQAQETVLGLLLIDHEYFGLILEYFNGQTILEYLKDDYIDCYITIEYLYSNFANLGSEERIVHFNSQLQYDCCGEIITCASNFLKTVNNEKIFNDALACIVENYLIEEIEGINLQLLNASSNEEIIAILNKKQVLTKTLNDKRKK